MAIVNKQDLFPTEAEILKYKLLGGQAYYENMGIIEQPKTDDDHNKNSALFNYYQIVRQAAGDGYEDNITMPIGHRHVNHQEMRNLRASPQLDLDEVYKGHIAIEPVVTYPTGRWSSTKNS